MPLMVGVRKSKGSELYHGIEQQCTIGLNRNALWGLMNNERTNNNNVVRTTSRAVIYGGTYKQCNVGLSSKGSWDRLTIILRMEQKFTSGHIETN